MSVFVDKVQVKVEAGNGGDGIVSWRREKFVDRGGPNGGDGGDGGNIVFKADKNLNTLQSFRFNQLLKAKDGEKGAKQNKHGKRGEDLVVKVPLGTQVLEGEIVVADLVAPDQTAIVANGGKGGFGNAHFKSSKRQAPRVAEKGEPGEETELTLELKLLADVGLIGLPNAGKSTLLSVISGAKPEIADYPFTTLIPHLGVVDIDGNSLLVADIPGLIEGASKGKGLGDDFLRHIERTAVLVHLIDLYGEDKLADFKTITNELKSYKVDLSSKPTVVALSKADGWKKSELAKLKKDFAKDTGLKVFVISSQDKSGLQELLKAINKLVIAGRKVEEKEEKVEKKVLTLDDTDYWEVNKKYGKWQVTGKKIERFAVRTDQENIWALERLRHIMQKMGIIHELVRQGAEPGDIVRIKDIEMEL